VKVSAFQAELRFRHGSPESFGAKMKPTLRILGIVGLLCSLLFFPIHLERPPLSETRNVFSEESKAGTIAEPARHRLEEAIARDTERARSSIRAGYDHALLLDGIIALSSAICLVLSMRKGQWVQTTT
jgi:hypothetical protein